MTATMARQGGRVQLEQSDMRLALNKAKIAKEGFLRATIEETQQLIKKPRAEVRDEKTRGVEFPGHKKVKAAIDRHPAKVYKNFTDGWLACQNGTAKDPQKCWRRKGTGTPPPELPALLPGTPPLTGTPPLPGTPTPPGNPTPPGPPPPPGTPPAPPGDSEETERYEIEGMPSRCVYIHSPLPNTQFFNYNAYAKDSKHDKDFIPDFLSTLFAAWQCHWH